MNNLNKSFAQTNKSLPSRYSFAVIKMNYLVRFDDNASDYGVVVIEAGGTNPIDAPLQGLEKTMNSLYEVSDPSVKSLADVLELMKKNGAQWSKKLQNKVEPSLTKKIEQKKPSAPKGPRA